MLNQTLVLLDIYSKSDLTVNVIPKTTSLLQTDFIWQSDIIYTY